MAYHLIECGMLKEAVAELCDVEGICARLKAGVLSTAVKQLADLCSKDESDKCSNHYLRWLRRSATLLSKDPSFQIVRTIYEQPKESLVRNDMDKLLNVTYPSSGLSMLAANRDSWIRCRQLGGYDKYSNLMADLHGHSSDVSSVCVSPDGRFLFSSSRDNTIKMWDLSSSSCVSTLEGHSSYVTSVCVSPDGRFLFSSSDDKTIKMWDLSSTSCVSTFKGHSHYVTSVCVSPDGRFLLSSSYDNTICLVRVRVKEP